METATEQAAPQQLEFKTELKQLLNLIIHSLYTKNEIFLRELVSNAADAIDKVRFESLTNTDLVEGNNDWKIRIVPNESDGTLTISDNGIGLDQESAVENLGTIAKSGTAAFLEKLKSADAKNRPELIGQFGVGFYSAFMVADRVTVVSRPAGDPSQGVKWESDGQGQYTVERIEKPARGTDVVLHLKEDAREFLKDWKLREIVKRYSDFIEHPIALLTEKEIDGKKEPNEETLNSRTAIWLRPKHEIKPDEYNSFYKSISHDFEDPATTIHFTAEGGATDFRALLFIPARKPFDFQFQDVKPGVDLYVRRVLIQHECEELLPRWLRFVKGVVDSSDLPLNVSRETLQHNPLLGKIRSNLVNRVIKTLDEQKNTEFDKYVKFFEEFGSLLKEGVTDWGNRERVADLLLFESTKTEAGKFTTLDQYVKDMPAEQTEVYYLTGESRQVMEHSPLLERFKTDGREVLLMSDPVDEFAIESLREYKGKKLTPVDRVEDDKKDDLKEKEEAFKPLLTVLKEKLPGLKEVRLTNRLSGSASVLVGDAGGMSPHMERLMQRMGRGGEMPPAQRILELNPSHPVVEGLQKLHASSATDPRVQRTGQLLYEQAILAEGSKLPDPTGFAKRINELLNKDLA